MNFLMCKPTFFDIEYSINPWMDVNNKVDRKLAASQWQNVYDVLTDFGCNVMLIEPAPGLPDMTFSGDAGIVHGKKFVSSNFRYPQRQGESIHYKTWFAEHGYDVITLPKELFFEGLGDVVYYKRKIIFGYGPRSSPAAIDYVLKALGDLEVVCKLKITDPKFFHIALGISFVNDETVLFYPDAFSIESRKMVREAFDNVIEVDKNDAENFFVCNNILVGDKLLLDNCSKNVELQLNDAGYDVVKCGMSEYKKSGGSLRCLVLKL